MGAAPAGWLVLAFATGLLGAAASAMLRLERGPRTYEFGELPGGRTMLLSVTMIAGCGRAWHREYGAWQVIDNIRS